MLGNVKVAGTSTLADILRFLGGYIIIQMRYAYSRLVSSSVCLPAYNSAITIQPNRFEVYNILLLYNFAG